MIMSGLSNIGANAETERFMRTLKEELLWLEEFAGLEEARNKVSAWIDFYNNRSYTRPWAIRAHKNMRGYSRKLIWKRHLDTTKNQP